MNDLFTKDSDAYRQMILDMKVYSENILGLRQIELSREIGMTPKSVSDFFAGKSYSGRIMAYLILRGYTLCERVPRAPLRAPEARDDLTR